MKKPELLKKVLFVDYLILIVLLICKIIFQIDLNEIIVVWVAQISVTTGVYGWKAKSENRVKVPIKVIESLSEEMRKDLDMTQIIISIIQSE